MPFSPGAVDVLSDRDGHFASIKTRFRVFSMAMVKSFRRFLWCVRAMGSAEVLCTVDVVGWRLGCVCRGASACLKLAKTS